MRAVLLTGGIYHDFDRLAAATAGILAAEGFRVEIVGAPGALVAALAREPADLVVVQALRFRMLGHEKYAPFRAEWAYETGEDLMSALTGHVARGGGVVSLHTGCVSFDDWPGWRDILGGGWVWGESFHAPDLEPIAVTPVAGHPVTAGVAPFTVRDEHYRRLAIDPGSTVVATGVASAGDAYPVAWARDGSDGRAFTLTVGHDLASLTEPGEARMIRNGALWAARQGEGRA